MYHQARKTCRHRLTSTRGQSEAQWSPLTARSSSHRAPTHEPLATRASGVGQRDALCSFATKGKGSAGAEEEVEVARAQSQAQGAEVDGTPSSAASTQHSAVASFASTEEEEESCFLLKSCRSLSGCKSCKIISNINCH